MRLLRELPPYTPIFHHPWKGQEIDCVLQPPVDEYPPILIEFKLKTPSRAAARDVVRQLRQLVSGWSKETLVALIAVELNAEDAMDSWRRLIPAKYAKRMFWLYYDVERDEFTRESEYPLLEAVHGSDE